MTTIGKLEIDISSKELQELIKHLGHLYQDKTVEMLLGLYHKCVNDQLYLEDIQKCADRFGVDLEELYMQHFIANLEMGEDDEC